MSEAPQESDALIGREIGGKYVVERFLGGGAMGAVYRARQVALDKNVAIKVMHRELAVDAMFAARFHREARAASRLDHPNSIRVIDFGAEPDGTLYIAMELVDGRDLYKVIHEDWPIPKARVVDILMQALAAIATAHEMGVIHRDLKPENIMILRGKSDDGHAADVVKVCDFGIAKINEADDEAPKRGGAKLTTQGVVVGTPEYMSPEQAKGEKLDARSDLYSMGVILYQLITGRVPFEADTALATVLKHVTDEPVPPEKHYPGVDKKLAAIAMRAMSKSRDARFQTARDMRAELRAALDSNESAVPAAPETAPMLPRVTDGSIPTAPTVQQSAVAATVATGPASPSGSASPSGPPPPEAAAGQTVRTSGPPSPMLAPSSSKVTPVGTESRPSSSKSSRWMLFAVVVLVLGAGFGVRKKLQRVSEAVERQDLTIRSNGDLVVTPPPSITAEPTSSAAPSSTTVAKLGPDPKKAAPNAPRVAFSINVSEKPTANVVVEPAAPPPAATTEPPPPPPATTPSPPPVATAPPVATPTAPPFDPSRCRASAAPFKSNGSANASNLRFDAGGAAQTCFAKAVREKGAPWSGSGTLTVKFDQNGRYKGVVFPNTMDTLPGLGNCIRAAAGSATLRNLGDLTDAPEFTTALSFTCN